jgi:hypothetical protein
VRASLPTTSCRSLGPKNDGDGGYFRGQFSGTAVGLECWLLKRILVNAMK